MKLIFCIPFWIWNGHFYFHYIQIYCPTHVLVNFKSTLIVLKEDSILLRTFDMSIYESYYRYYMHALKVVISLSVYLSVCLSIILTCISLVCHTFVFIQWVFWTNKAVKHFYVRYGIQPRSKERKPIHFSGLDLMSIFQVSFVFKCSC